MFLSKITITLRKSILDPQGKAVEHAIGTMNIGNIRDVRMGKYIELKIDAADEAAARTMTEQVCTKLLANPIMEDFHFEVEKL
ncbi:MAG: phosphoribosylformylglycinamidine synthase subunit PurS [Ignavibacteriae bacterium]|nr:phosphoribosylformylglycinamidine synthase subunit PurS [Ignavibacteriota bacterium]